MSWGRVGRLVLMRHGQSTYNAQNRFTGRDEAELTPLGREQAVEAGLQLRAAGLQPRLAFCSSQTRAEESCRLTLRALASDLAPEPLAALDERDYGELTGLDKAEAMRRWGEAQVARWRRSYADGPPGGENLRDVTARVARAHLHHLLPAVLSGGDCLVTAHGNSLRALVGLIEDLSPESIEGLEISPGGVVSYEFDRRSRVHRSGPSLRSAAPVDLLNAIDDELRLEHGDLSREIDPRSKRRGD